MRGSFFLCCFVLIGCGRNAMLSSGRPGIGGANQEHVVFYQKLSNALDVVIVDDNSGSMESEQRRMGPKFASLLEGGLAGLRWQLAITTPDVSDGIYGLDGRFLDLEGGGFGQILTYQTPNANAIFQETIVREESNCFGISCPSSYERPILALIRAMERHNVENAGFFRDDADLIGIIVSDEDEPSEEESLHFGKNRRVATPDDAIDTFDRIWGGSQKKFTVYALIVRPDDQMCLRQQNGYSGGLGTARYGRNIAELVRKTGGSEPGNICSSDYGMTLRQIGQRSRQLLGSLQLPHRPTGDVQVTFNQGPLPLGTTFSVQGNKLSFHPQPPPEGTRIDVYYNRYE